MKYQWKNNYGRKGVSPSSFAQAIESLGEQVTPKAVVDLARPESSPIHSMFEWDDSVAAEQYRQHQAGNHLRALVLVRDEPGRSGEPLSIRAFVSVEENESTHYTTVARAMSDAELRQQVLDDAMDALRDWESKYEHLQEFAEVFRAAKRVERKLKKGKVEITVQV